VGPKGIALLFPGTPRELSMLLTGALVRATRSNGAALPNSESQPLKKEVNPHMFQADHLPINETGWFKHNEKGGVGMGPSLGSPVEPP
jgi:hypothetical protein